MRTVLFYLFVFLSWPAFAQKALEPCTYSNDFESKRLGAWASYPLWQDNAYDQNFQIRTFIPGDPNISLVQKVTPYSSVDNYAGAQKLLDMYLVRDSKIRLRYYLKSNSSVDFFKVRLAAGEYGKIDVTLAHPKTNEWTWIEVGFDDFARENPSLGSSDKIRIYALAFLAKVAHADPDMPVYMALDDISFSGARTVDFRFTVPSMDRLPEFREYIPKHAYHRNDSFRLKGDWALDADDVSFRVVSYTDTSKTFYSGSLRKSAGGWAADGLKLSFPEGLYLGRLVARNRSNILSETVFTIHITPRTSVGQHPRLLFDEEGKNRIKKDPRFESLYAELSKDAIAQREKVPVAGLRYDLDQFPDENWLPSWVAFGEHIYRTGAALKANAFVYAFSGDTAAGNYVKHVLLRLSGWPGWTSPWMIKRGRYSDHRMGTWSHAVALAYDLTYGLMSPSEAASIRKAILVNIVEGAHYTYVYDNEVISNTSNWIAHIMGGSIMNMAAISGDGPETDTLETLFTGAVLKFYSFLTHVTDRADGAWGEGYGYNNYTFSNLAYSIPTLKNVFNIDLSAPLEGSYNEYIWGGTIRDRRWFAYGDSDDTLVSSGNWGWLLSMDRQPRLSWYYHYLKGKESFDDLFFDVGKIPQDSPFKENPVKVFRKVGTTVFKSGWEKDDLVFVMRTGAFFNHQHLDQGSFQFADRGIRFIEDQPIHHSDYYNDPLYQPAFIQPVSHSTILINGNAQSQRTGDPLDFAPGFNDHARVSQFLDGADAAFSSGDIGRLYWGEVDSLSRNVLFIKPRTLLMLDLAAPKKKDVDVTLLYHTSALKDIDPGSGGSPGAGGAPTISKILKEGVSLNIVHLFPDTVRMEAVETPHYLRTLLNDTALVKEGVLTETVHTHGAALVIANLLTTTKDFTSRKGDGFVSGGTEGRKFVFTTRPGRSYVVEGLETDALAVTWSDSSIFVAMATRFSKHGGVWIESDIPMSFEIRGNQLHYYRNSAGMIKVRGRAKKVVELRLPEGEGRVVLPSI